VRGGHREVTEPGGGSPVQVDFVPSIELARAAHSRYISTRTAPRRETPGFRIPRPLVGRTMADRVILDVDRQMVLLGVGRDYFWHRPRDQHAIAFEPEVPVQTAGMVLLDHEPRRLRVLGGHPGARFARLREVAFGLVLSELLRPLIKVRPPRLFPRSVRLPQPAGQHGQRTPPGPQRPVARSSGSGSVASRRRTRA
jgi:hypothetical protein